MEYKHLSAPANLDTVAECYFRYVHGYADHFNPHFHDFYEIFLTVKGTVIHHINGTEQKLAPGSLVFIRPDDRHGYRYSDSDSLQTEYLNLAFSKSTAQALFSYLFSDLPAAALLTAEMPPMVLLSPNETRALVERIGALNCADWDDKLALKYHVRVLLVEVFSRYFAQCFDKSDIHIPEWLKRLTTQMSLPQNFMLGSERMVELSGKSREHVARSLKKYLNTTLSEYINGLRINYASNLLVNTNMPILAICYECGFQSPGYFYRLFNASRGISPRSFRILYGKNSMR